MRSNTATWHARLLAFTAAVLTVAGCGPTDLRPSERVGPAAMDTTLSNSRRMVEEGRRTFRFDTFGSEAFWGEAIKLHQAVAGAKHGGVGGGVSPKTALAVGLKVDSEALPASLVSQIKSGAVNLDDPATTLALLKLDAVVGVKGLFDGGGALRSMGVTCALCHSTVDDSFAPGIGHRLDGWANRDLNVGVITSLAPNLQPIADLLKVDVPTVKKVLTSWGPGKYDAELDKDGKAFRPDGKFAATLLPPAFGLAGVNLATWTGFGSVTYWNAYVAVTQMHGVGTYVDVRLKNPQEFPVAARSGSWNTRGTPDQVTSKLAALFSGKAKCATCHVPPLYTEPGQNLHAPAEIGVDSFQADRSPTRAYRTAPLKGLWTHQKGGFYHDGRFPGLREVVSHYNAHFGLRLTDAEVKDLIEHLKSL
ncbi:MAG TPA: hypothetical protein VJ816_01975 [Gemmatimonadales bacterium]|nr:hypothetical protein [Gemmatimonadales bacterium]